MEEQINQITKDLLQAKANVRILLDEPMASVDMHGIAYWAGRVEKLREQLQGLL